MTANELVSIHARTGRATVAFVASENIEVVSIHARTGRATFGVRIRQIAWSFNSRAHGARDAISMDVSDS